MSGATAKQSEVYTMKLFLLAAALLSPSFAMAEYPALIESCSGHSYMAGMIFDLREAGGSKEDSIKRLEEGGLDRSPQDLIYARSVIIFIYDTTGEIGSSEQQKQYIKEAVYTNCLDNGGPP